MPGPDLTAIELCVSCRLSRRCYASITSTTLACFPGLSALVSVRFSGQVLEPLARMAPGMLDAQLLLARSRFLSRDFEGAQVLRCQDALVSVDASAQMEC
eukprot:3936080-Rhodomonas_salina.1